MDDTLCPRCRSPLFHDAEETPGGYVAVHPVCSACNWEPLTLYSEYPMGGAESAKAEALATLDADVSPLAWFEPRDRLPTPEEDAAHTARYGDGAGWMVEVVALGSWSNPLPESLSLHRVCRIGWRSYPHVNGRPVGWPEVNHG